MEAKEDSPQRREDTVSIRVPRVLVLQVPGPALRFSPGFAAPEGAAQGRSLD